MFYTKLLTLFNFLFRPENDHRLYQRNGNFHMAPTSTTVKVPVPFPVAVPVPIQVPIPVYCYLNWPNYNDVNYTNQYFNPQIKKNKKQKFPCNEQNVYDNLYSNNQYYY